MVICEVFVYPINSSYKYVKKVKLNPNFNPNIFSELMELQENGASGGIQAQIPNCTVYIGIAAQCNDDGLQNSAFYKNQINLKLQRKNAKKAQVF